METIILYGNASHLICDLLNVDLFWKNAKSSQVFSTKMAKKAETRANCSNSKSDAKGDA